MRTKDQQNAQRRRGVLRRSCRATAPHVAPSDSIEATPQAADNDVEIIASIIEHQPDPSHTNGLTAIADALVLQMFDSGLGETLRMAYTMLQNHQERQGRRAARFAAVDVLRDYLAQLEDETDDL